MTKSQKNDLKITKYFIPKVFKNIEITNEDEKMYFEWSESGKHKDKISGMPYKINGFNALVQGKEWRGIHMGLYEQGVLDSSVPYLVLLGGNEITIHRKWWQFWKEKITFKNKPIPREIVDFMKKEMFKGKHSEMIEQIYQKILAN